MFARALILLAVVAVAFVPAAQTATTPAGPTGLHAFLLRSDEPATNAFAQTPSFAWNPTRRAKSYDFELATSKSFDDSTIIWSTDSRKTPLAVPTTAIPVSLPWMTGNPYALYAHVRAHTTSGVTRWSPAYGFNMSWKTAPEQMLPAIPGLVRWTPVEGATSYEVWFIDVGKVITTATNVADEREYYSFHPDAKWTGTVQWRVRPVRKLYGTLPSGLPAVSVGPWSQTFVSSNPTVTSGGLTLLQSVADVASTSSAPVAHGLTPGFSFSGDTATNGVSGRLFRVYVATDPQCVNIVFTGAVVGSPAYAPRTSGPTVLPTTTAAVTAAESAYPADGAQTGTYTADYRSVTTTEQATGATAPSGTSSASTYTIPPEYGATGASVDLWDSGWPSGRYYWTVVPVREVATTTTVQYYDAEVPQDACAAGRVMAFGKTSQPATIAQKRPYSSGLSPSGTFTAARSAVPSYYKAALIAWTPAFGATGYEVQWSKTKYPWKPASATPFYTAATSLLLEGLDPGTWYYRVRGIDPYVPGTTKQMTWSPIAGLKLVKPTFSVQNTSVSATHITK